MGKKDKGHEKPRVAETRQLTHSPFASLTVGLAIDPIKPNPAAVIPAAPAVAEATVETPPAQKRGRGRLVLRRETKHRAGKAVIVVAGFAQLAEAHGGPHELESLTKELKQLLGCGGTVTRELEIVLQADNPSKIAQHLRSHGYRVVGVGC